MAECRRIDPNHVGPHCGCAGDACALDAPRPTSGPSDEKVLRRCLQNPTLIYSCKAEQRLDALVARVTDLEARNATLTQNIIDANARSRSLAERHLHDFDRAEAAEAQVAALTQDRDSARMAAANYLESFQAAEAALATTRQALTFYADESTYVEGDEPHPREFATYVTPILADEGEAARRALAATEEPA